MSDRILIILTLTLFFFACVFLNARQEYLFSKGADNLVTAYFVEPANPKNFTFRVSHLAPNPRALTIRYRLKNKEERVENVILKPEETRDFASDDNTQNRPTITITYTDNNNQEVTLTLYKK